ncbi:hypothetical protein ACFX14_008995 [Malus domestica]
MVELVLDWLELLGIPREWVGPREWAVVHVGLRLGLGSATRWAWTTWAHVGLIGTAWVVALVSWVLPRVAAMVGPRDGGAAPLVAFSLMDHRGPIS